MPSSRWNVAGNVIVGIILTIVNVGYGYIAPPTFSLTALGGSGAAVVAQLSSRQRGDERGYCSRREWSRRCSSSGLPDPITPGKYGFIQELGLATLLATVAKTQAADQFAIVNSSSADGTMTALSATFGRYAIGYVVVSSDDSASNSSLRFR